MKCYFIVVMSCFPVRITIRENVDLIRLQNQLSSKSTALRVTQEKFNDLQEVRWPSLINSVVFLFQHLYYNLFHLERKMVFCLSSQAYENQLDEVKTLPRTKDQ